MLRGGAPQARSAASPTDRPAPLTALPAWAGIIGPARLTATFLAAKAIRIEEYNPRAQPIGALESGPNQWIRQVSGHADRRGLHPVRQPRRARPRWISAGAEATR